MTEHEAVQCPYCGYTSSAHDKHQSIPSQKVCGNCCRPFTPEYDSPTDYDIALRVVDEYTLTNMEDHLSFPDWCVRKSKEEQ